MRPRAHGIVLALTVFGFGSLYTPQPLLPVLSAAFGVDAGQASLLITLTMLPLAVAPLLYGYILEGVPARRMMGAAALGLALCQAGLALAGAWWQMLLLRSLEGLFLPALFTALMTYAAAAAPQGRTRQAMAWYIATSILGGFGGRAASGLLAEHWHWRAAFAVWALGLLVTLATVRRLPDVGAGHFAHPHPRVFAAILARPCYRHAYAAIFCVFFVFSGFLNVLPFRLRDLDPTLGTGALGLAYTGYLVGIAVTLGGQGLVERLGSERRALLLGTALFGLGLATFLVARPAALYLGMLAFCGGMFLLHGRLSGQVNHLAVRHRGIVNGLYISIYYLGGGLGSWAAPQLYRGPGWGALIALLGLMLIGAAAALSRMLAAPGPESPGGG